MGMKHEAVFHIHLRLTAGFSFRGRGGGRQASRAELAVFRIAEMS